MRDTATGGRRAIAGGLALLAVLVGLLAGCGGGTSGPFAFMATTLASASTPTPKALACTSPTFCLVLADDGSGGGPATYQLTWDGKRWSAPTTAFARYGVDGGALSCASPHFCAYVAEGADSDTTGPDAHATIAATWDGSRWSPLTVLAPTNTANNVAVSCPADGICLADDTGRAWRFSDGRWSAPDSGSYGPLSCASPTFCLSAADSRTELWDGSAWSARPAPDGLFVDGVACSAPQRCTLLGEAKDAVGEPSGERSAHWTGTTWSPTIVVSKYVDEHLTCPTADVCYAIEDRGRVFRLGQGGWSGDGTIHGGFVPQLVVCPTITFCASDRPLESAQSALLTTKG